MFTSRLPDLSGLSLTRSACRLLRLFGPAAIVATPTSARSDRRDGSLLPCVRLSRRAFAALAVGLGVTAVALPPLVAQDGPRLPGFDTETRTAAVDADDDTAEEDDGPVGLSLALPEDPPDSIRPRAWEELPSTWEDWSIETGDRVADLYSGELSIEEQRYALERLNVKLRTLRTAIGQSQYANIRGQLVDFEQALSLRVELAEAALDAIVNNRTIGAGDRANRAVFQQLFREAVAVGNDLNRVRHGEMWKRYLRLQELKSIANAADMSDDAYDQLDAVLGKLSGDDADADQRDFLDRESLQKLADQIEAVLDTIDEPLSDDEAIGQQIRDLLEAVDEYEASAATDAVDDIQRAMRNAAGLPNSSRFASILSQRYQGTNVRGSVSESLIQRLMAQSNFERGVVNDCVLGARIVGCQFTNSNLTVDLQPSPNTARFQLNLAGTVQSRTTGYKSPATVYSVGNHAFASNKTVTFDGYNFAASPAAVGVNVNNRTTGVTTSIKFPIFRRIARNIARKRVAESAPRVRQITRDKIVENVGGRFNDEVNELLGKAESRVQQKLYAPLSRLGLTPAVQTVSTTDITANLDWTVAEADELTAGQAPPLPIVSGGVAAQIHESYLNAFADRLDLHGRTLTNQQLRDHIRMRLESAFGRSLSMASRPVASGDSDDAVANAKFVFDTVDPVRVRVEDDRIVLLLRTGLELEDKDDVPTQIVEIPLNVSRVGSQVILKQGDVSVSPVERGGGFRQIARSKVMIQKIEATGDGQRTLNGSYTLQLENKQIPLTLQTLRIAGGWITATMQ